MDYEPQWIKTIRVRMFSRIAENKRVKNMARSLLIYKHEDLDSKISKTLYRVLFLKWDS